MFKLCETGSPGFAGASESCANKDEVPPRSMFVSANNAYPCWQLRAVASSCFECALPKLMQLMQQRSVVSNYMHSSLTRSSRHWSYFRLPRSSRYIFIYFLGCLSAGQSPTSLKAYGSSATFECAVKWWKAQVKMPLACELTLKEPSHG